MKIREICLDDIDQYIVLAKQLGYETDKEHLKRCIINKDDLEIVFVAEFESKIIGWIDCKISHTYLKKDYCEIVGLVVDEMERSKGIGKKLMSKAENWAKDKGTKEIIVRSNIRRERAHKFYLNNGYVIEKQSMVFKKET